MDLETLRFARFGLLEESVADWTTLTGKLAILKRDADDGLRKQANQANWTGENEKISKQFIGRTAGEFADAHAQAVSIRNILRDTCGELKDYQARLNDAIARGLERNLTVVSTAGGGFTVSMNIHPDRAARGTSLPSHTDADATALRDEVQRILDGATQSDSSATRVLTALVDQSKLGFSDVDYADRDTAADALRQADALAQLAKKNPEALTVEQFDRLNAGLRRFAGDALFAERFAANLGGKGTLEFWADLNRPMANPELMHERREQMAGLQRSFGLTLATASQSDTTAMETWRRDVVALTDRPLEKHGGMPFGGQIMSNLMRWGDYDDKFLHEFGNKLVAAEKKLTHNGGHAAWQPLGVDPQLNHTGTDTGWDPMTGYFKALANNPDAATDFFGATFLAKDEDHDFKVDGKDDRRSLSNFEYFFEERDWPHDYDEAREESIAGRNNLAMALEAATTGHPAGEMPTADLPPHSNVQAKLMSDIVASVAENPKRLTDNGYMSDSIGQIASEYLPDINRAIADDPHGSTDKLFPLAGTQADLHHRDVSSFLVTVGQNPQGYAAIEVGQKAYMADLMDYHLNPDLPADQRYPHSAQDTVEAITRRSGEVSGTLSIGVQEAVLGPAAKEAKEFSDSVAQQKNAWSGAVGTGIGAGVSFIATPVGGAVVGGAATTVSGMLLEHIFQQSETDVLNDAGQEAGSLWETSREQSAEHGQMAAADAAKAHGLSNPDRAADWALKGRDDGFSDAAANVRHMSDHLTTEVPAE
ncbi:hypothetical protein SSP531S_58510 [Streptomyces spongiicola]|uniref:DUF6571 domain-containing protein n=1 Tax=Streptomyces spongiicola TaxID=1690221 RepID=A0A388T612_9ACTN|nr:DUF6571 family protein [Streptomyces spongiicola]GBQ04357.1 hypothetical protein SSP531S_58510 [Streptomyces spongiicola]